jgi:uncharacterized protein YdiU (UPF0061 family)
MNLKFKKPFTEYFPGDVIKENYPRQVFEAAYSFVKPKVFSNPKLIKASDYLANGLGWDHEFLASTAFLEHFSGQSFLDQDASYAMAYGGHQFGHWAGQLGDGRAINIGYLDTQNGRLAFQLKGAGPTPYSRGADGFAVLRSSIREFLCSEAMHFLNIPTTRALSIIDSGDTVLRDKMYDGNAAYEKGAIVCRVAPDFIRFGHFELFASRNDQNLFNNLAEYLFKNHFKQIDINQPDRYFQLWKHIALLNIETVGHWMRVGFVHGVMNTDNISVLGETIDYGPFGFLDAFQMDFTPNTTVAAGKRYAYGKQLDVLYWNILMLANAFGKFDTSNLNKYEEELTHLQAVINDTFFTIWSQKLGFETYNPNIQKLIQGLLILLEQGEMDFTLFFIQLEKDVSTNFDISKISYSEHVDNDFRKEFQIWLEDYETILKLNQISDSKRIALMQKTNPKFIIRNYMYQNAIEMAEQGDFSEFEILYQLLQNPYSITKENEKYITKMPHWAKDKIGCGRLSCSS